MGTMKTTKQIEGDCKMLYLRSRSWKDYARRLGSYLATLTPLEHDEAAKWILSVEEYHNATAGKREFTH